MRIRMEIEKEGKKWTLIKDYGEWMLFQGLYYKTGYRKTDVDVIDEIDKRRKR